ncbi:MAG: lysine exporter LysO family protein [Candidatus Caldatribacteriaceae bacterium]
MIAIFVSLFSGFLCGFLHLLPASFSWYLDSMVDGALLVLVFGVGMELASNDEAFRETKRIGFEIFLLPLVAMRGSLLRALGVAVFSSLRVTESLSVASGFGWYSLSGVLLARLGNPSLGLLAFMTNVFREIITLFGVGWVYRVLGGWAAVALGGATSMDTTLGLLSRISEGRLVPLGVTSGVVHSLFVPICIALFSRFL